MADDKKKAAPPPPPKKAEQEIIFLLAGLFILALIVGQLTWYFRSIGWGNTQNVLNYFFYSYLLPFWHNWKYVAVAIGAVCLVIMIHSLRKLKEIKESEKKIFGTSGPASAMEEMPAMNVNERWEGIKTHAHSTNPSDWRLAIMEADIMLEEVLRKNGLPGDTIGEMLKSAQPGDFVSLDAAWEAHKIRNRIAHDGASFDLNDRETQRVISLFEQAFREFKVI